MFIWIDFHLDFHHRIFPDFKEQSDDDKTSLWLFSGLIFTEIITVSNLWSLQMC